MLTLVVISLLGCDDVCWFWVMRLVVLGEAEWALEIDMHNFISNGKQFIKQYCLHFNYYNHNMM